MNPTSDTKSTILTDVELTGSITFSGELTFDGKLSKGDIKGNILTLGPNAKVLGNIEADALTLPFADNELDCISVAFGFRNLANYRAGLAELLRVLKPGGQVAILEFSHPTNFLVKLGYGFYSSVILPLVGTIVSGSREAYTYLPSSIRKFPKAPALADMMRSAGFAHAEYRLLTGGIAALHIGTK